LVCPNEPLPDASWWNPGDDASWNNESDAATDWTVDAGTDAGW
jgi:hypothetical protein